MGRFLLWRSRSLLCKQLDFDIWNYCTLNMFRFSKALRYLFKRHFDKKSSSTFFTSIFYKADRALTRLFVKRKSYYGNLIVLKRKVRFFFGFPTIRVLRSIFFQFNTIKKSSSLRVGLISIFEKRLDFCVWRLRIEKNLFLSRRFITINGIYVNGILSFTPSFLIDLGCLIELSIDVGILYYLSFYRFWYSELMKKFGNCGILRFSIFESFFLRRKLLRYSNILAGFYDMNFSSFYYRGFRFKLLPSFLLHNKLKFTFNNFIFTSIRGISLVSRVYVRLNLLRRALRLSRNAATNFKRRTNILANLIISPNINLRVIDFNNFSVKIILALIFLRKFYINFVSNLYFILVNKILLGVNFNVVLKFRLFYFSLLHDIIILNKLEFAKSLFVIESFCNLKSNGNFIDLKSLYFLEFTMLVHNKESFFFNYYSNLMSSYLLSFISLYSTIFMRFFNYYNILKLFYLFEILVLESPLYFYNIKLLSDKLLFLYDSSFDIMGNYKNNLLYSYYFKIKRFNLFYKYFLNFQLKSRRFFSLIVLPFFVFQTSFLKPLFSLSILPRFFMNRLVHIFDFLLKSINRKANFRFLYKQESNFSLFFIRPSTRLFYVYRFRKYRKRRRFKKTVYNVLNFMLFLHFKFGRFSEYKIIDEFDNVFKRRLNALLFVRIYGLIARKLKFVGTLKHLFSLEFSINCKEIFKYLLSRKLYYYNKKKINYLKFKKFKRFKKFNNKFSKFNTNYIISNNKSFRRKKDKFGVKRYDDSNSLVFKDKKSSRQGFINVNFRSKLDFKKVEKKKYYNSK